MTDDILCHNGKCEYQEKSFLDECINCNEIEQIEYEMLRKSVGKI